MTLQTSGAISLNQIHIEAGGSSGHSASLNDPDIRDLIDKASGATNSFNEYYGASSSVTFTYELIGGGGAGGYGRSDGGGSGNAASGSASSISAPGLTTITSAGASGGANGAYNWNDETNRAGDSSFYGAGGAGAPSNSASPGSHATNFGAGGGGGGSDAGGKFDNDGASGEGGDAAVRVTGTATVDSGTTVTIVVGGGGAGFNAPGSDIQGRGGGNGGSGVVKITVDGVTTTYNATTGETVYDNNTVPASRTHTVTLN